MKPLVIALVLSTAVFSSQAMALSIDTANLTRTLSFPEPAPEPVTKEKAQIKK